MKGETLHAKSGNWLYLTILFMGTVLLLAILAPYLNVSEAGDSQPKKEETTIRLAAYPIQDSVNNKPLVWPALSPVSSRFGPAHPLGIDIDLAWPGAPEEVKVVAAQSGLVTHAEGNRCCSYGHFIIIDHQNGFQTLYAHLEKLLVEEGQRVAQGEVIAIAGSTGYSTGRHLHFEVHLNGRVVDPLVYLP